MSSLLQRASRRFFVHHPWQLGLAIVGIALGVAVVVSIDLARTSAGHAFDLATQAVVGKATHRIIGGPAGLNESWYVDLRVRERIRPAAPVIEGYASLPDHAGQSLQILGVDPFAERPFRDYWQGAGRGTSRGSSVDLSDFVSVPGAALMNGATAQRLGIQRGDWLSIRVGAADRRVHLFDLLRPVDDTERHALDDLLITDIATAQELLGIHGTISRIDLIVAPDPAEETTLERIRRHLPPGAELTSAGARGQAIRQMTRAFYENLMALSLLALLVGIFLIYNTMSFVVVQRRGLIGTLRAVGATRRQVFWSILTEAIAIGLIGTAVGLALGIGLGHTLLGLMTRTINDVYFVLKVSELTLTPLVVFKGIVLGVGATLAAALVPAREAASVTPRLALERSQLESRISGRVPHATLAGFVAIASAALLIAVPVEGLALGLTALFVMILGCALLTPAATRLLVRALRPMLGRLFGVLGQLAARSVTASLSRTAVAIAALMIAVATMIGIGLMIGSFRLAVHDWLHNLLRADLYISAPESSGGPISELSRGFAERLASTPGVAAISTVRRFNLETETEITHLVAYELAPKSYGGFRFTEGDTERIWQAFEYEAALIISEPYAYHHGLKAGGGISLRTDRGAKQFTIAGVYRDYSSDRGVVAMSRRTFERYWAGGGISSIGVYAEPGMAGETLRAGVLALTEAGQALVINSNRAIIDASMQIFDRTFTITQVLRLLAGAVAFLGIFSALMALQLERTRELGVLRACGLTPRQLWTLVLAETGLMGVIAGILSLPVGGGMAFMLVSVINRRSFGWTMDLHLDAYILVQGFIVAVVAAVLAGIYPALRMARTSPAEALRGE